MPETVISLAKEPQELAVDLIDEHHEHLQTARVLWLFTSAKRTSGGHVTLGTSGRSNPLQRFLSSGNKSIAEGYDFIVQLDEGRWRRALATQRKALVDHLLCRMIQREVVNRRTGEMTHSWGTIGPDVAEFSDVIRRHGLWLPEQQVFARAASEQGKTLRIKFPDLEGDEEPEKTPDPGKPPTRATTVDAEGTVVSTETLEDNPTPEGATQGDDTNAATTATSDQAAPDSSPALPESTNGDASGEVEHVASTLNGDDWQSQAGIGVSDIAQQRARRRGTASSEQPAAATGQ